MAAGVDYLAHLGDAAALEPFPGTSWPAARRQLRAVTIEFTAGYPEGDTTGQADVPAPIRDAIKLMVGDLYANRESQVIATGVMVAVANDTVDRLLRPYQSR
jgi:hypothetical protein